MKTDHEDVRELPVLPAPVAEERGINGSAPALGKMEAFESIVGRVVRTSGSRPQLLDTGEMP